MSSNRATDPSFISGLIDDVMLAYRLMLDSEVPSYLKLIPVGVLAYLISPIDLLPEALLGPLGLADDPLAVLVGLKAFINLAPSHIVDKYVNGDVADSADIVDGEYVREPTNKELHETIVLNPNKANGSS